jgi:hypothetical protein
MPGLEGLDLVDRFPPRPEAADGHALAAVHVNAVADRIAGDDQLEIRDVEDGGVVAVGVADLDDHEIVSFEREAAGTTPPSLALFLLGGVVTSNGAAAIYRASLGVVIATARADDCASALATLFVVGYAALSLPVLGLGIGLLYLSPKVILLIFGLVVGLGMLAAAPSLIRRPDTGR